MADDPNESFADRVARESEDALAKLVAELSENQLVRSVIGKTFEARERAAQAQEVAFAALNIPSASDIERLTRRIRSVSLRMEGLEDGVDRIDERLAAIERRLDAIVERLESVASATSAKAPAKPAAKRPARSSRAR